MQILIPFRSHLRLAGHEIRKVFTANKSLGHQERIEPEEGGRKEMLEWRKKNLLHTFVLNWPVPLLSFSTRTSLMQISPLLESPPPLAYAEWDVFLWALCSCVVSKLLIFSWISYHTRWSLNIAQTTSPSTTKPPSNNTTATQAGVPQVVCRTEFGFQIIAR